MGKKKKASYFSLDDTGAYVYKGPLYALQSEMPLAAKKASIKRVLMGGVMTLLSVLCGFLPPEGIGDEVYILLPYAIGFICTVTLIWKAGRVAYWSGDNLREYVYQTTIKHLPALTFSCAIFAGFSVIGEVVRLVLEKSNSYRLSFAIIFMLAQAMILVLAVILHKSEREIVWKDVQSV